MLVLGNETKGYQEASEEASGGCHETWGMGLGDVYPP